jgi:scyllo-inositol 2-dehydrogenase (NADP+)
MGLHPLRVAVIGYGIGGAVFHAPLVASTAGLQVAFVVTGNEERAADVRRGYADAAVVASPDELWARADEIDLVVVTSPNREHAPLALTAIAAGLPVVVDKPFAIDAEQGQQVIDAAAAASVPLTVFQNRRWDGDFLTLRRLLRDGKLGAVTRFESRFERWRPTPKGGWRELGGVDDAGGLLYDLGAHLIDQALVLFGPVAQVYAEVDIRRAGVRTDDDTFVSLTHANGVRSQLWVSAIASSLGPRLRVLGDRASYVKYGLDVQEDQLRAGRRPDLDADWGSEPEAQWGEVGTPSGTSPVRTEPGAYQHFYAAVRAALRGEGELPVDPRDSLEGLRIIAAAQRSHRERAVVAL